MAVLPALLSAAPGPGAGVTRSAYEVKAAYLYRFGKLAVSPSAAKPVSRFSVCASGEHPIAAYLASLAGKTAKGAPSPSAVSIRGNVERGFVGKCPGTPLGSKPGQAVLTVADCPGFAATGGMVELTGKATRCVSASTSPPPVPPGCASTRVCSSSPAAPRAKRAGDDAVKPFRHTSPEAQATEGGGRPVACGPGGGICGLSAVDGTPIATYRGPAATCVPWIQRLGSREVAWPLEVDQEVAGRADLSPGLRRSWLRRRSRAVWVFATVVPALVLLARLERGVRPRTCWGAWWAGPTPRSCR